MIVCFQTVATPVHLLDEEIDDKIDALDDDQNLYDAYPQLYYTLAFGMRQTLDSGVTAHELLMDVVQMKTDSIAWQGLQAIHQEYMNDLQSQIDALDEGESYTSQIYRIFIEEKDLIENVLSHQEMRINGDLFSRLYDEAQKADQVLALHHS